MRFSSTLPMLRLVPNFFISVLLCGCAGYNTAMFTTKSNAGLDIDMKPPTAEITITRKEAVIEPAFEQGQTLPVMASFKPKVNFSGGFKNYFLGVDQTFAGGDAAVTMSKLYNLPTLQQDDLAPFNSALHLGTPLKAKSAFIAPAKPGSIRPFIFGTDTILGLKIAWSGVGGQIPDTVKIGFNRKEFAWAPITVSTAGDSVKMPSFLATIQSGSGGGSNTNGLGLNQNAGISSIQYFATGESATRLALQKDVRDAMLSRLDPKYKARTLGNVAVLGQILDSMANAFSQLRGKDALAAGYFKNLQDLKDIDVPTSFDTAAPPMIFYIFTPGIMGDPLHPSVITKNSTKAIGPKAPLTIATVDAYLSALNTSIDYIEDAEIQVSKDSTSVKVVDGATPQRAFVPADAIDLQQQLDLQKANLRSVQSQISSNKDIEAALAYFNILSRP